MGQKYGSVVNSVYKPHAMLDNDQAEPNPVHTEASNSVSPRESTQLDNSEHSDPNPGTPPEASQQD